VGLKRGFGPAAVGNVVGLVSREEGPRRWAAVLVSVCRRVEALV